MHTNCIIRLYINICYTCCEMFVCKQNSPLKASSHLYVASAACTRGSQSVILCTFRSLWVILPLSMTAFLVTLGHTLGAWPRLTKYDLCMTTKVVILGHTGRRCEVPCWAVIKPSLHWSYWIILSPLGPVVSLIAWDCHCAMCIRQGNMF